MPIPLAAGAFSVNLDADNTAVAVADGVGVFLVLSPKAHDILARAGLDPDRVPPPLWVRLVASRLGEPVRYQSQPGDELVLSATRLPLADGTSLVHIADATLSSRTLCRQLHRLRLETIEEVVASFAPSLRSPLSSLLLNADLLAEAGGPNDADALEDIHRASTLLRDAVDNLVGFAGLQGEPAELTSVADAVAKATDRLQIEIRDGSHQVELEIQPGAEQVKMNPRSFQRVLRALLENAFEAALGSARVRVVATATTEIPEWPMIRLSVQDNGPGVPPERRAELFEPFFSTKDRHLGLGLTLARESVRDLGGDLVLEPHSRSTFTILLPTETSH